MELTLDDSTGVSPEMSRFYQNVMLEHHSKLKYIRTVGLLLKDVFDPMSGYNCALQSACERGNYEIVELLIRKVDRCANNQYCIRSACENGHVRIVELLLSQMSSSERDVNLPLNPSCMMNACEQGHHEIVELLLKTGHGPSFGDDYCIRQASRKGHVKVVELLLEYDQDNLQNAGHHSMCVSIEKGNVELMKMLLEKGVDPSMGDN